MTASPVRHWRIELKQNLTAAAIQAHPSSVPVFNRGKSKSAVGNGMNHSHCTSYVVLDMQSDIMRKDFASSHKGIAVSGIASS